MKHYLRAGLIAFLLCIATGLVFAQDATQEPEPLQAVNMPLPSPMETALVPCGAGVTGPCEMIATSLTDIAGIWKQYLLDANWDAPNGMAFQQMFPDGSYNIADTLEHTAQPFENYPTGTSGMLHFEGDTLIMEADPHAPAPFNNPAVFQVRVLKYGNQPVALHFFTISDTNFIRQLDLTQVMIWVAPNP